MPALVFWSGVHERPCLVTASSTERRLLGELKLTSPAAIRPGGAAPRPPSAPPVQPQQNFPCIDIDLPGCGSHFSDQNAADAAAVVRRIGQPSAASRLARTRCHSIQPAISAAGRRRKAAALSSHQHADIDALEPAKAANLPAPSSQIPPSPAALGTQYRSSRSPPGALTNGSRPGRNPR